MGNVKQVRGVRGFDLLTKGNPKGKIHADRVIESAIKGSLGEKGGRTGKGREREWVVCDISWVSVSALRGMSVEET